MRSAWSWMRLAFAMLAVMASAPLLAHDHKSLPTCIARLDDARPVAALIADPAALDCAVRQSSLGPGDYLVSVKLAPVRPEAGNPLVLRTASVWQDSARIHFHYADGKTETLDYTSQDAARFLTIGAIFEFPVPWRAAALDGIFIEARNSANLRGVVVAPELETRSQSFETKSGLIALYGAFGGLALALIVYNLSLWAAMRHRFQLWYCAMVASLMAYTFTSAGVIMQAVPVLANNDRLRINHLLLALAAATALQFIRHFFEARVIPQWLLRAIHLATGACLTSALALALLAPQAFGLLNVIYYVTMTLMLGMVLLILVCAWRARSLYFWMFVLAWSAPTLTSALRAAYGFGFVGYSFILDNSNLIALSVEALFSSIMISMRLREMSAERDEALANEQVARRLAATDPLTGLLNRRAFLDHAIGRGGRQRLMLIDIDHFKAVNDRLGHDGGDEVLRAVAEAIQTCRPAGSLAVRLGGEEFALLLPRGAIADCPADRVLEAVRHHAMPQGTRVTVSIGLADGTMTSEEDWKRLYRLADAALYRAKSDGRDRACRATDFRAVA